MSKFGDAFKAARAAGKSTFTFNGKSYHTRTKDDTAKSTSKPDITAPMQAPAVKANPMADRKDTDDRVKMGESRKRASAPISRGDVERDYKEKMKAIIKEKADQERMDNDPLGAGMRNGGFVNMTPKHKKYVIGGK